MAKRLSHKWGDVKPGDIISFKYKPKSGGASKFQTILVLNPRLFVPLKAGGTTRHLIGLKLKEYQKIKMRLTAQKVKLLEKIGDFELLDEENQLYRLNIKDSLIINDIKGIKRQAYNRIAKTVGITGQYRTYDWKIARKSPVYLEPIRFFTDVKTKDEDLTEVEKPMEPKKVEKPKKPKKK